MTDTLISTLRVVTDALGTTHVADALHVSRDTVSLWYRGENLPHEGLHEHIMRVLEQEASLFFERMAARYNEH
jgi:DNA-binding transcriptional regulator YiaG